ncbi:MAG: NADH-quinone oxidoreductase subunit N [Sulfurovum sp.]|nr:NADH-quinone oxidoreductase subunit N [Sulfurovaceae bacterium]
MLEEIYLVLPMSIVVLAAFILMILSNYKSMDLKKLNLFTVFFLVFALAIVILQYGTIHKDYLFEDILGQIFIIDDFALLFDGMFISGTILTLLINTDYFKSRKYFNGEYFSLLLFALFGMMLLAHSHELMTAFIGLEIASLSIYALVGYHKSNHISSESMMKYLILGSLTSAMFVLGTAFIYGQVASTTLTDIAQYTNNHGIEDLTLLIVGASLIMITIFFKIGAVPFHAWVLDVYHGSPFPVTMFMASTFKIAIFAILLRLYVVDFVSLHGFWTPILQIATILTLIGGSLLAITQTSIKRMLAASSIVHSGYMLIAITSIGLGSDIASGAVMFYLIAYFLSSVGAFGILSYISAEGKKNLTYNDFKGFSEQRPYLAILMSIFMLSLAGFPSTIGFMGKFYIFTAAVESKQFLLAGVGIVMAFISVYYYFKLILMMYFYPSDKPQTKLRFTFTSTLIILMAILIIWGGIGTSLISFAPSADGFIDIAQHSIETLE